MFDYIHGKACKPEPVVSLFAFTLIMTRLDDRDQFLRDFRREVNDCVRVVTTQLDNQQVLGDVLERILPLNEICSTLGQETIVSASAYDSLMSSLHRLVEIVSRQAEVG